MNEEVGAGNLLGGSREGRRQKSKQAKQDKAGKCACLVDDRHLARARVDGRDAHRQGRPGLGQVAALWWCWCWCVCVSVLVGLGGAYMHPPERGGKEHTTHDMYM